MNVTLTQQRRHTIQGTKRRLMESDCEVHSNGYEYGFNPTEASFSDH